MPGSNGQRPSPAAAISQEAQRCLAAGVWPGAPSGPLAFFEYSRPTKVMLLCFAAVLIVGGALADIFLLGGESKLLHEGRGVPRAAVSWAALVVSMVNAVLSFFLLVVPLVSVCFRRRLNARQWSGRQKQDGILAAAAIADAAITAVIPCYLPNEQDIIEGTVLHILEHLETPGALAVWVVYNTPQDLPEVERRLEALSTRTFRQGRRLRVLRAKESTSKAQNLNAALKYIETPYVAIYDADHHPDPGSMLMLYEKLCTEDLDLAQGSTYIRNLDAGLRARYIDAEFFVNHWQYYPAMGVLTQKALYGGSNCLWRVEALRTHDFDRGMMTEDVDISIRSQLDRCRFQFCMEARSGELAPVSLRAYYKQRMRWQVGWEEVSLKYISVLRHSKLEWWHKAGIGHILYTRWLLMTLALLTLLFGSVHRPMLSDGVMHVANGLLALNYGIVIVTTLTEACCQAHHRGKDSAKQVFFVAVFMIAAPIYVLWTAFLVLSALARIRIGHTGGWVVTQRTAPVPPASAGAAPTNGALGHALLQAA